LKERSIYPAMLFNYVRLLDFENIGLKSIQIIGNKKILKTLRKDLGHK
jgi:hypothetical protein